MPYLRTINDLLKGSMSPDDMRIAQIGLNALTRASEGTAKRAPMPAPRRKLFTQGYWSRPVPHPDYLHGDQAGTTTRKELTTGGREQ